MSELRMKYPRPWKVKRERTGFWFVRDADGDAIVNVGLSDEAEANAHLIAAAPDLKAALEALLNGYDSGDGSVLRRDIVTARTALARTEENA